MNFSKCAFWYCTGGAVAYTLNGQGTAALLLAVSALIWGVAYGYAKATKEPEEKREGP